MAQVLLAQIWLCFASSAESRRRLFGATCAPSVQSAESRLAAVQLPLSFLAGAPGNTMLQAALMSVLIASHSSGALDPRDLAPRMDGEAPCTPGTLLPSLAFICCSMH